MTDTGESPQKEDPDDNELTEEEMEEIFMDIVDSCMRAHSHRMRLAELREQRRLKRPLTEHERQEVWQEAFRQERTRILRQTV